MTSDVHFSSKDQTWQTPWAIFDPLHAEFKFTIDVCAIAANAMLDRYYSPEQDGLAQDWRGESVWCNPPYGRGMGKWVEKCAGGEADIAVAFIPARTDTKWFHAHVLHKAEIRFLKGRVCFQGATSCAPFPSMLCIWKRK